MAWRLPYVQVVAGGGVVDYLVGETNVGWSADLTVRTSLGRELAIDLSGAYRDRWDVSAVEGSATVFFYF
ncbi:MAG: hypothetical protein H0W72_05835 [Planctomycetes bacterium]|nr:hypothetical protein [Planctomycetota bacterium]